MNCPCGSGITYTQCCEPIITGVISAPTAETLMRSRYTAYTRRFIDYIYNTYSSEIQRQLSKADIAQWANSVTFVRLVIIPSATAEQATEQTKSLEQPAFVEFSAFYIQDSSLHQLHEKSLFILEDQQWRYCDGLITEHKPQAIGRNDLCPCQSGKKFKKCHQHCTIAIS